MSGGGSNPEAVQPADRRRYNGVGMQLREGGIA